MSFCGIQQKMDLSDEKEQLKKYSSYDLKSRDEYLEFYIIN